VTHPSRLTITPARNARAWSFERRVQELPEGFAEVQEQAEAWGITVRLLIKDVM
jgi:hypothetical protein